tara:strand:- start:125 stop:1696 length:1572 start_codon:yes stop_codon:yes gene_type:complete
MPVTFNSNNNYSVDIVSELDINNPSSVQYSSISNTPFVEVKITPTNSQTNPVLASNIKIDGMIPSFIWNGATQIPQACEPPPPPHNTNSSLQHLTGISVTGGSLCAGINGFNGNSNAPQQGPYIAENDFNTQTNEIAANGVSWSQILLIEVYESDNAILVNDGFTPATLENYNNWAMWQGLVHPITNNVYPKYVKAFVYLNFGSNGLSGLTSNTTLNLDIDEVEPIYGCTDSAATNYDSNATIDDNSCVIPNYVNVNVNLSVLSSSGQGYNNGPYTSGQTFTDLAGNNFTTTNFPQPSNLDITSATTINLGSFVSGHHIQQLVTFDIQPVVWAQQFGGLRIYNYPLAGGPNANISQTSSYSQNPGGWGDAKNNLTAASLAVQATTELNNSGSSMSGSDYTFYQATYQGGNPYGQPPVYSDWHNGPDPTGAQPTKTVIFVDANSNYISAVSTNSTFSSVYATEIMNPNNGNFEQWDYFPEKVTLNFMVDYVVPFPQGPNQYSDIDFNIKVAHNTERQGDFNWTI